MPTNEERREVARKLRGEKCGFAGWVGSVYIALEVDGETAGCDMLDLLADLIEPEPERTCENESSKPGIFTCSYCGADFYDAEISGDWNYCPNCGAKVIENEVTPTPL